MKYAFVNPNWTFEGSTYFGCQEPHYPLELLFPFDKVQEAGHEALLVDAQVDRLSLHEVKRQVGWFEPDFLVVPTAPSYLFWRCPQPELRVSKWLSGRILPARRGQPCARRAATWFCAGSRTN
jgi:hypothetical protein